MQLAYMHASACIADDERCCLLPLFPWYSRLTSDLQHLRQLLHDEKEAAAAILSSNGTIPGSSSTTIAAASKEQLQHGLSVALAAQAKERARNAELVHRLQQLHSEHVDVLALQRQYAELQDAHYQQVGQHGEMMSCHVIS
jgi:hypothetical protein